MAPPDAKQRRFHIPVGPVIAVFAVLILSALLVPTMEPRSGLLRGQLTQTVHNGRQIYIATQTMAEDGLADQDPRLGWPGDLAVSKSEPVNDLASFVERLVKFDYLNERDLAKLFTAPGVRAFSGPGRLEGNNSAFKIYLVTASDSPNVLFLATKNFTFGHGLDANTVPYRDKGFAIVRKGGDAQSFAGYAAQYREAIGVMPGHTKLEDPGAETSTNVWKD